MIENENVEINQVISGVSEKIKQEKENELISQAIENFNNKCQKIAVGFKYKKFKLIDIVIESKSDEPNYPHLRGVIGSSSMSMSQSQYEHSTYIMPGESKIYVEVKGIIELI